jgi:hypothetical protein
VQDAVAADALVEDAEAGGLLVGEQAAGEFVGPARVGVEAAVGPVGDAVAERDDGGALGGTLTSTPLTKGQEVISVGLSRVLAPTTLPGAV